MLSRIRSSHRVLLIMLLMVLTAGWAMAVGSDATKPRAIPYTTSNLTTGLNQPTAVAIDTDGNIYVGENKLTVNGSALIKKIDAKTGAVTVFAGGTAKATSGSTCPNPDLSVPGGGDVVGDGCPATYAFFGGSNGGIRGLAVYNGYLYLEDLGGYYIHRINLTTNIMELVGGGPTSATWPGDGGPTVGATASSNWNLWKPPTGFAVDPLNGNVYFGAGGTTAATIRMITSDTTTCQNATNGPFTAPCVITVVNYTGQSSTPAPVAACADPTAVLVAKSATVNFPQGLAFDADRNLYIAENKCGAVRKLTVNPATGIVDQSSQFTTLAGNNTTSGTSPSWYDTTAAPSFLGAVRGVASAGGNDLYISTTTAVYFYDATTKWAHRIWSDITGGCAANSSSPYIGCPAPWATRTDGSGTGAMAVDKAGNLYITDYAAGTVAKAALGTDFIGTAPEVTTSLPTNQYVLLHGGAVTGATADAPFSAVLTTDTVPSAGCTTYSTGDNGTDCVIELKYSPSVIGLETGLLHALAVTNSDLPLQGLGDPAIPPQVTLSSDTSLCSIGGACDVLLTATVTPGDKPVSSGLAVTGDMSACTGGTSSQAFVAGSSNTFTYTCSLPTTAVADVTLGPVTVTDDQARTANSSTVLVNIIGVPVAQPQSVTVSFNTPKSFTLTGSGAGTLSYTILTQPSHGALSGTAPDLTYTPTANYTGTDSFTFKITDGNSNDSEAATVDINVLPAAPVAMDQSVTATYNTAKPITLTASGAGTLTYTILTQPSHGALTGTAPDVTYTPASDYTGADSFTFKATDSNSQDSAAATVSINVVVPPPVANAQSVSVTYNVAKPIVLSATGFGTVTYTVLSQPTHGTLSGTAPNLTFTPTADYSGSDSFTFKVTDGMSQDSAAATISITVSGPALTLAPITGGSTTATVTAGNLAVFNLQVAGWNGAAASATVVCTGAPAGSICGVSPPTVTLDGTTARAIAVTVQTGGGGAAVAGSMLPTLPTGGFPWGIAFTLTALVATLLSLKKAKVRWQFAGACATLLLMASLSSCGGSSTRTAQTQAGTYTLTVTATSGDVTKSLPLTLNVR